MSILSNMIFRREITEKGLKLTRKFENGWKKVVRPAGPNTQQSSTEITGFLADGG